MKSEVKALIFTSVGHFANDGTFLLFSALIVFYTNIGIPVYFTGSLAIVYTFLSGIFSLYVGKLSDRSNKDPELMSFGILIMGISVALLSLPFYMKSGEYIFVTIGAIILGVGQAFYHPIGANIIRFSKPGRDMSDYLGINGSFGSLGRSILILVFGGLVISTGKFSGTFLYGIIFIILSGIIYSGTFRIRKPERRSKKINSSMRVELEGNKPVWGFIGVLTTSFFLRSMFLGSTAIYIFSYLDQIDGNNSALSFIFLGVSLITPVLGQPFFGYLTRKKGGYYTVMLTGIISLVSFILFLSTNQYYIALIIYSVYAFAAYTGFPTLLGFIGQNVPASVSARANTIAWGLGNTVGGSVGLGVFLILYKGFSQSLHTVFYEISIFLLLSILITLVIPRFSRKIVKEEINQ
ncbi:MAG: MFS transporter [Thermoplasmataceae archaeon]